jgi:hypothetical protein
MAREAGGMSRFLSRFPFLLVLLSSFLPSTYAPLCMDSVRVEM